MALNYLASSWSRVRSGLKIENESSQQTLNGEREDHEGAEDPDANAVAKPNETDQEEFSKSNLPQEMQEPILLPPKPLQITPKRKRKDRQRKRKRRPSTDTSLVPTESEGGDISSIPYRQDEEAERTLLLNELRDAQDKSLTVDEIASTEQYAHGSTESTAAGTDNMSIKQDETTGMDLSGQESIHTRASKNTTRNRYTCPKAEEFGCDKTFTMLSSARRHAESVHSDTKKQCPVCEKTFKRSDALNMHKSIHTEEELKLHEENLRTHDKGNSNESGHAYAHRDLDPVKDEHEGTSISDYSECQQSVVPLAQTILEDTQRPVSNGAEMAKNNEILSESEKSSSTSVFDVHSKVLQEKVIETPAHTLKRKRDRHIAGSARIKKSRSGAISSPRSITSDNSGIDAGIPMKDNRQSQRNQSKNARTRILSTGNLNGFVKAWTPGSDLYHPIHNPKSPPAKIHQAEIVMPPTSTPGSSSKIMTKKRQTPQNRRIESSLQIPLATKMVSAVYSSPKGKSRAEPGVEYSSPNGVESHRSALSDEDDENYQPDDSDKEGIATTVARRTLPKKATTQPKGLIDRKPKRSGDGDGTKGSRAEFHKTSASPDDNAYLCQECHRKFPSLQSLRKHETRTDVHKLIQQCEDCHLSFGSRDMLIRHEKESGHGDGTGYHGRKGVFTADEVEKLIRWRNNFCDEHELTHTDFNDMMTDSLRRGKGTVWPHRFINKADFLQEYYDVLPDRNRRSMHRYRERVFQNLASSNQEWTKQDDDELVNLVNELGTRWVDIGQRLSRTQDAVAQRWRNKLQYRGRLHDGEWLPNEINQLTEAVKAVKRESGLSLDPNADVRLSWESVSRKMKGSRTAQQCSNKWRLMHVVRKNGKFIKGDEPSFSRSASSTPLPATTPSKMNLRLSGRTMSASKAKAKGAKPYLSEEFVQESDEEGPSNESDEADSTDSGEKINDDASSEPSAPLDNIEAEATSPSQGDSDAEEEPESPELPRNPLSAATPKNAVGLSQIFNQTQANTSALRAPRFDLHFSTQPERKSPNVPLRMRRETSSLQSPPIDSQKARSRERARFARRKRSKSSIGGDGSTSGEAVTDAIHKGADKSRAPTGKSPAAVKVSSSSQNSEFETSSDESSTSNADSEDEEDDEMVQDTKKESFMQSLKPPEYQNGHNTSKATARKAKDWHSVIRGRAIESEDSSEDE